MPGQHCPAEVVEARRARLAAIPLPMRLCVVVPVPDYRVAAASRTTDALWPAVLAHQGEALRVVKQGGEVDRVHCGYDDRNPSCSPATADRLEPSSYHLVAWIGGVGALSPTRVPDHATRTYSGRPSSSIRFSTLAAIATSLACRPSVCERSPSPITRFHLEMSASTRARQLYPEAFCQPRRPRSARHRRCRSLCVGGVSAVSLGPAFARGGTITAAAGWRAAISA